MTVEYPFSVGDRLKNRNMYTYTPYHGDEFMVAWVASRDMVVEELLAPLDGTDVGDWPAAAPTSFHLNRLAAGLATAETLSELDLLVRHFEVTKRIYREYNDSWRPINPADYDDLSLYAHFARVVAEAYQTTKTLTYLNTMLKVIDTLIAMRENLSSIDRSTLVQLIRAERIYVNKLGAGV